jgi:4-amino-4-deoxy-L-arabinose transferase-like glycosyltransferase
VSSRPWARSALGLSALILPPFVVALIVLAVKFGGLDVPQAMEHAQIARRVASGEGFSTSSIRPISLAVHRDLKRHPDLYHAPGHPLLLALAFGMAGPSDRAVAATGLLLWLAAVFLTFWAGRRWFGTAAGALAAAFTACNVAMLKASLLGLPYPLAAILVLTLAVLSAPSPRAPVVEGPRPEGSDLKLGAAGLVSGLAAMTHYLFFFFAPAVGLYLVASRRRRGRALALFAAGLSIVVLPWMIRNFLYGRSPFFSFYWYEAMAGTDAWPGDAVFRSMAAATTGPWEFAFVHPLQMIRKISGGLLRVWQESLSITDPVVAFLFAAALIKGRDRGPWHGWLLATAGGMILTILASCVFRAEPELLLAWTPLLAIPASAQLLEWLVEKMEAVSLRRYWSLRLFPNLFRDPQTLRVLIRRGAAVAVVAVVAFPLFHYIWIARGAASMAVPDTTALSQAIPPEATVMTDQPALVAWRGPRRAVWLCLEERDWEEIEARGGPITATYVSPSVPQLAAGLRAGWWWWISAPRGVYRGLAPVEASRLPGVMRVKKG